MLSVHLHPSLRAGITQALILHHVGASKAGLRETLRVLRPGGKVLIADWVVGEVREKGNCFKLTAGEIVRFLARIGFQNINVESIEPYLALVVGEKNGNSA